MRSSRKCIAAILNLPYSLAGILLSLVFVPNQISFNAKTFAIIIRVRRDHVFIPSLKGWRGMVLGNIAILNQRELTNDLEHELIHVEQNNTYPFIMFWLNVLELLRKGYANNRFELEAYRRAGNPYLGGTLPKA